MQIAQENQNPPHKVKNTFSTDSSKRDEIENDDQFKSQRQKYLQERLNRRKQVKQIRKQKFGSSSSESEKSLEKPKITIINDFEAVKQPKITEQNQKKGQEESFHAKHQAYIKEKMARKQQLIVQRRKQFGNSSSDSDDDLQRKIKGVRIQNAVEVREYADDSFEPDKPFKKVSQVKRSMGNASNNDNSNSRPIIVQQIVYTKGEKCSECKKMTILIQSKKNLQWIEETLVIENKRIKLLNQNVQLLISHVSKIKLFFTSVSKDYLRMKITIKDEDYLFGVSYKTLCDNLPQYYYLFARIVQEKLAQIGFQPRKNEPSIFPNYQNLKDIPLYLKSNSIVFGNILKKSQYLGNWERRFVYIADKQIGSCKRPMDKPSMIIETESINELWTRFDIENNSMLTIKIMYNSTKTQFAIPISSFTDEYNWMYSFFRVIRSTQ